MKMSDDGVKFLASLEGCVLSPYKDSVGVWTIGFGHTAGAGKPFPLTMHQNSETLTFDEAVELLREDLARYEKEVSNVFRVVHGLPSVPQNVFDAAVSFHYNTGAIGRASWVPHYVKGNLAEASRRFMLWNKPSAIVSRRAAELKVLVEGDYGSPAVIVYDANTDGIVMWGSGREVWTVTPPPRREVAVVDDLEFKAEARLKEFLKNSANPKWGRNKVWLLVERGAVSIGRPGNDRNVYDDKFTLITCHDGGDLERVSIKTYTGNSDPSVFRKRVATLAPNQAVRYRPGLHGFNRKTPPYPAFRQDSEAKVIRDTYGADHGMFYINIHRGGKSHTNSLGCLTLPPAVWPVFRDDVNEALRQTGKETFWTVVLDAEPETLDKPERNLFLSVPPMKGEDVKIVQKLLNRHRGAMPITEDGIFGPKSQGAVVSFQRLAKLGVDGIVGPRTFAKLNENR